jgi:hypothetical protein
MEKPKRTSGILRRINLQGRREFEFVAPLSLEECRKRLQPQTHLPLKIDEKGEFHFYQTRDAGKNLVVTLDAWLAPLDDAQTHVHGNARIVEATTAMLALVTLTHGGIMAVLLAASAPAFSILPPAFIAAFWFVCLKARTKLIDDLMNTLDVKAKGKMKNRRDPEAE